MTLSAVFWRGLGGRRLRRAARDTCLCGGYGTLPAGWVFRRADECTCGAGDSILVLHDRDCDTVPCPFCPR